MENLVKIIRASLQGASITTQTVDAQAFIDIVGEMINHNPDSLYPKRRQLDPYSDLNYQCVEDCFDLKVRADYLTLGLRENGRERRAPPPGLGGNGKNRHGPHPEFPSGP